MKPDIFAIDAAAAGMRLDKWLCRQYEALGLRGARRMVNDGKVYINGKPGANGARLKVNDAIKIAGDDYEPAPGGAFLARQGAYLFFYKPAGMNTVRLAGRANANLEDLLPALAPPGVKGAILLQRLDRQSSGIICAAADYGAMLEFRNWEKRGLCKKSYFALLDGCLDKPVVAKNALAANSGKRVKILAQEGAPLRWTEFTPLWQGELDGFSGPLTLANCEIRSGLRHQVRAHARALGMPLAGDGLYGNGGENNFILEHYKLRFPGGELAYTHPDSIGARLSEAQARMMVEK